MINHPCMSCGACCNFYRVSFHWSETLADSYEVPIALTTAISLHTNAMNGTNQKLPRCVALKGIVGDSVSCGIYLNRPGCCRTFKPSFEDGTANIDCDNARKNKDLIALTLMDWL